MFFPVNSCHFLAMPSPFSLVFSPFPFQCHLALFFFLCFCLLLSSSSFLPLLSLVFFVLLLLSHVFSEHMKNMSTNSRKAFFFLMLLFYPHVVLTVVALLGFKCTWGTTCSPMCFRTIYSSTLQEKHVGRECVRKVSCTPSNTWATFNKVKGQVWLTGISLTGMIKKDHAFCFLFSAHTLQLITHPNTAYEVSIDLLLFLG